MGYDYTDIVQKCINKERKAEHELFKICFHFLMPVCVRYGSNLEDAKEYLNIGFFKILNNLKKYKSEGNFEAWSKRVLVNSIIDEIRKSKSYHQYINLKENTDLVRISDKEIGYLEDISPNDLLKYLQKLPPLTLNVFNLFVMEGYKHKEIAEILSISLSASKWHYASAKEKLIKMIMENKPDLYNKLKKR